REIRRNTEQRPYEAEGSQQAYEHRRKASVSKGIWTEAWAAQIEEKLHETWSPEQIVERFRQEGRSIVW
ncbi:UNVERIFIED_CONTAM: IS30 family transposase, partial [Paenibacillus sp. PvR008]